MYLANTKTLFMATMSIRSRKTNQRVDSCAQMQTHDGDDDGDDDEDDEDDDPIPFRPGG